MEIYMWAIFFYNLKAMIKSQTIVIGIIGLLVFNSCQEKTDRSESLIVSDVTLQTNDELRLFTAAVNAAIRENPAMVSVIKTEVLKKYDGDYEVLYKKIANKKVSSPSTRSNEGCTFSELIETQLSSSIGTRATSEVLAQLQEHYPYLQIAVPIHADQLNEDVVPTVAFIPTIMPESDLEYLVGFDSEGSNVLVDAINPPSVPVIIIGQNERLRSFDPYAPLPPNAVVATRTTDSIVLSWESVTGSSGYDVYRKAQGESSFICVSSLFGANNISFEDTNIVATVTYSYYVVTRAMVDNGSIYYEAVSSPSTVVVVNAPSVLPALSSFSVECEGNHLKLRWMNEGITNCNISLSYYNPNWVDPTPQLITTVSGTGPNSYSFWPPSSDKGKRIIFEATRTNALGNSDTVHDFVYPPFRNVDDTSWVKLTKIDMLTEENMNHLEHWYRGAPEFYVKLVGVNSSGSTQELVSQIEFQFDDRTISQTFNRKLYNWLYQSYGGWYSALRIYIIEGDNPFDYNFPATAQVGAKVGDRLEFSLGNLLSVLFTTNGQDCGFFDLMYYENPVIIKETQQEQLLISLSD